MSNAKTYVFEFTAEDIRHIIRETDGSEIADEEADRIAREILKLCERDFSESCVLFR